MKNAGFTLIEIMLVTAIGGLLVVIALVGQHELQARARFDAAIAKTIQNFAYARTFAQSNVNISGGGSDTTTAIAGTAVEPNNGHYAEGYPLVEITTLYAQQDGSSQIILPSLAELPSAGIAACPAAQHPDDNDECSENFFDVDDHLTVTNPTNWFQIFFINTGHGLKFCHRVNGDGLSIGDACTSGSTAPFDVTLADPDGFTATIEFAGVTGFAKRL